MSPSGVKRRKREHDFRSSWVHCCSIKQCKLYTMNKSIKNSDFPTCVKLMVSSGRIRGSASKWKVGTIAHTVHTIWHVHIIIQIFAEEHCEGEKRKTHALTSKVSKSKIRFSISHDGCCHMTLKKFSSNSIKAYTLLVLNLPSLNQSWAMPDSSLTSGTGLTLMPECRCRIDTDDYQKKCKCRTNIISGILIFIIFCHLLKAGKI